MIKRTLFFFPKDNSINNNFLLNLTDHSTGDSIHNRMRNALFEWLSKKLRKFIITKECCLGKLSKHVPQIFTSERKYADVGIKSKSLSRPDVPDVIVQFEVVSNNDVEATRLKLAFGLCDQLRYIMNHSHPIHKIFL